MSRFIDPIVSNSTFKGAITNEHEIYIAFDKKVIKVRLEQLKMYEIWSVGVKEELLAMDEKDGIIRLLIRKRDFESIANYRRYRKNEQGEYEYDGMEEVIFVTGEQAERMVPLTSQEFLGYCSEYSLPLYRKRGIFLEWDSDY